LFIHLRIVPKTILPMLISFVATYCSHFIAKQTFSAYNTVTASKSSLSVRFEGCIGIVDKFAVLCCPQETHVFLLPVRSALRQHCPGLSR